jgi:hypothetical protein
MGAVTGHCGGERLYLGFAMDTESRVDSYTVPLDAELAKAYLQSHGIAVRLEGEDLMGAAFGLGPMLGGVRLFVDKEAGERARLLLANYHRALLERTITVAESQDRQVDRAWNSALLGAVFIPVIAHVYSIWLLLNVDRMSLTQPARKRYVVAWVVDVAVLLAGGLVLLQMLRN